MAESEAVTAAQAELDQANAALKDAYAAYDPVFQETVELDQEKLQALQGFKDRSNEIGGRLQPLSEELDRREADVRRAAARLDALKAGESGEPPPAQGIAGGEQ
jgi:chromosome segregation ATPase